MDNPDIREVKRMLKGCRIICAPSVGHRSSTSQARFKGVEPAPKIFWRQSLRSGDRRLKPFWLS
ncbi:hypothetical protein VZG47_09065 [Synechococcus elongatus IITB5]